MFRGTTGQGGGDLLIQTTLPQRSSEWGPGAKQWQQLLMCAETLNKRPTNKVVSYGGLYTGGSEGASFPSGSLTSGPHPGRTGVEGFTVTFRADEIREDW